MPIWLAFSLASIAGLSSLLGVIFAGLALRQILRSGGAEKGKVLAIVGVILGVFILIFSFSALIIISLVNSMGRGGFVDFAGWK